MKQEKIQYAIEKEDGLLVIEVNTSKGITWEALLDDLKDGLETLGFAPVEYCLEEIFPGNCPIGLDAIL
ncbi:hypothetical protein QOT17_017468 [Balamuthia mandrillaris]